MSLRVCVAPGCPELVEPGARGGRCGSCQRDRDRQRGSAAARGYGKAHKAERAGWKPHVEAGKVRCRRCLEFISPDAEWDLGHPDKHCGRPLGPEHRGCNRATQRLDRR